MKEKYPWWSWLVLAIAWAFVTAGFFWVFGTIPRVGHILRWFFGALPTAIVLPFVIDGIRR